MGRLTILAVAALLLLGGCAGPRVLTTETGERPLALVEETQQAGAAVLPASDLVLVVDSDEIGLPPVRFPESADYPEAIAYPAAPALPDAIAAPEDEEVADEAAPKAPTELAPTEEEAAGGVMKGNTVIEGDAPALTVEIAPPAPLTIDAPRLGGGCGDCNSCDRCWGNNRCGGYVGGSVAVLPGLGGALEFGVNFRKTERVLWSWDFSLLHQDMTDGFVGTEAAKGKFNELRLGVRARLNPCCSRWHPTFRAGIGWMNLTGEADNINTADLDSISDYIGGYVGVGIEYDINRRWSTGPEAAAFAGWNVDNGQFGFAPTFYWHFNYKF